MLPGGRGLAASASGHPSISNQLGGIIWESGHCLERLVQAWW